MILYGRNAVREALRGRRRVHTIWATERAAQDVAPGRAVRSASPGEIESRCGSDGHQGVCAEVDPYSYADPDALLSADAPFLVALDEITDPQNLGAICRTAECAGATGVVIPERRAAEVTPAVCKASAGAVEHVAVARVRNLADFLIAARDAGCWSYGAAAGATVRYDTPDYAGGHYRQPVAYDRERLDEAAARVARVREAARRLESGSSPEDLEPLHAAFFDALADDFNTARALGAAFEWIREANRRGSGVGSAHLRDMLGVLGLGHLLDVTTETAPDDALQLATERAAARERRDFAEADRLRDELHSRGWEVRDGPSGPELVPRS